MRRIDRDGGQQRIDLALKVALCVGAGLFVQFLPLQQPDTVFAQFRQQLLVPAAVLRFNEAVNIGRQHGQRLVGTKPVKARLAVAVLDPLHQSGLANFNVLVEVVGGDRQEFDPLQQRIAGVFGLFKHTPVKLHPGVVPAVEELLFLGVPCH